MKVQPWDNLDFRQLNVEVNEMALFTPPHTNRPLYDVTLDSLVTRLSTINKCIEDMKIEKSNVIAEMHKRNVMPVPTVNKRSPGVE